MKKESSEHQQKLLRKLVRTHKPTPAMTTPDTRKASQQIPGGRRTTRSETAKIRAKRVSVSKFDYKHSDDSTESADSQSEPQKQNPAVPCSKTTDNQSETNSHLETVEERGAKKPRKKRISRALFRHDTIDYIKPKKQELLQNTFSFKFKKLVDKSKEIYSKNDDDEIEAVDKNGENKNVEDNIEKVICPLDNTTHDDTNTKPKSLQLILDMPSLDSPNSQLEINAAQVERNERINKINSEESIKKSVEPNITQQEKEIHKKKMLSDSMPRNMCHIQTNSALNLPYPFYGIIPNKQNTITCEEQIKHQQIIEDQIPQYKVSVVHVEDQKTKEQDNRTVPPHFPQKVPQQFKVPTYHKNKSKPEKQKSKQIPVRPFPNNINPQMCYPYLPPNNPYGYPYNFFPYSGYPPDILIPQNRPIWNPNFNLISKESLNPEKQPRKSPEKSKSVHENLQRNTQNQKLNCTIVREQNKNLNQSSVSSPSKQNLEHYQKRIVSPEKNQIKNAGHRNIQNFMSLIPLVQNIPHRYHNTNEQKETTQKNAENTQQGQKRSGSPISNKINQKRVRFNLDSISNDKNNLLTSINYSKPDTDRMPIIKVNEMPNNNLQNDIKTVSPKEQKHKTVESVIVSPNSRRSEKIEPRLIATNDNQITQATCSVIKKVTTQSKNQHTIENILSSKCSTQNKMEINNNKYVFEPRNEKIKILNIENIHSNDHRYNIDAVVHKSVITSHQKLPKHEDNSSKIKSLEYESFSNHSRPRKITSRRKTLLHIDLTIDTDQETNSNSLNVEQPNDSISLNDKHTLVEHPNRFTNTQSEKNVIKPTGRPMPKLIKVPEELLNKETKTQTVERKTNHNRSLTRVNNYHNMSTEDSMVPLNLSLKNDAQQVDKTNENHINQNERQSIIVSNIKPPHDPLDLSTLTLVKDEEEYKGYLKLLKDRNATGPYLFYKFVTSVRKRNNQPIFDLMTFFSLLKQGKLLEYKNMYNECNNK